MTAALSVSAEVDARLRAHLQAIDIELETVVNEAVDDPSMRRTLGCHLGWLDHSFNPLPAPRDDRLAATVAVLCHQAVDFEQQRTGQVAELVPFAAAVELLHSATVVHEEVLHGDLTRQGRPALWTMAGRPKALQAAACLHALAFRCLGRLPARGVHGNRAVELMSALADTAVAVALGGSPGPAFTGETRDDPGHYLETDAVRAAALFGCAAGGGALVATAGDLTATKVVDAYRRFGVQLRLAQRIADDIAGTWGEHSDAGTPPGSDIRRRKRTLPVVFAFHRAPEHDRQLLRTLYSLTTCLSASQEAQVRQVLDGCGAAAFARAQAEEHSSRAVSALLDAVGGHDGIEANPFLVSLAQLARQGAR